MTIVKGDIVVVTGTSSVFSSFLGRIGEVTEAFEGEDKVMVLFEKRTPGKGGLSHTVKREELEVIGHTKEPEPEYEVCYISNGLLRRISVKSPKEGLYLISKLAEGDLSTDKIDYNVIDLLTRDNADDEWETYYDEEGRDSGDLLDSLRRKDAEPSYDGR